MVTIEGDEIMWRNAPSGHQRFSSPLPRRLRLGNAIARTYPSSGRIARRPGANPAQVRVPFRPRRAISFTASRHNCLPWFSYEHAVRVRSCARETNFCGRKPQKSRMSRKKGRPSRSDGRAVYAGSGTDAVARIVTERLGAQLGQRCDREPPGGWYDRHAAFPRDPTVHDTRALLATR